MSTPEINPSSRLCLYAFGEPNELALPLARLATGRKLTVRVLRGRRMEDRSGMFDEFATAFQFPLYFGGNWDAFDECLSDLEWLDVTEGLVVAIVDADHVLAAVPNEFADLVTSLRYAADEWEAASELGAGSDRPAASLSVVLQFPADADASVLEPWKAGGWRTAPLESPNDPRRPA